MTWVNNDSLSIQAAWNNTVSALTGTLERWKSEHQQKIFRLHPYIIASLLPQPEVPMSNGRWSASPTGNRRIDLLLIIFHAKPALMLLPVFARQRFCIWSLASSAQLTVLYPVNGIPADWTFHEILVNQRNVKPVSHALIKLEPLACDWLIQSKSQQDLIHGVWGTKVLELVEWCRGTLCRSPSHVTVSMVYQGVFFS